MSFNLVEELDFFRNCLQAQDETVLFLNLKSILCKLSSDNAVDRLLAQECIYILVEKSAFVENSVVDHIVDSVTASANAVDGSMVSSYMKFIKSDVAFQKLLTCIIEHIHGCTATEESSNLLNILRLIVSIKGRDFVSLDFVKKCTSQCTLGVLLSVVSICANSENVQYLVTVNDFWYSLVNEFVRGVGNEKKISAFLRRVTPFLPISRPHDGSLIVPEKEVLDTFLDTTYSIQQCSTPMLKEHVPQLKIFVQLVNDDKLHHGWFFGIFNLLSQHYNDAVLKLGIKLVCSLDFSRLLFKEGSIETVFVCDILFPAIAKQFVYENPNLGYNIIHMFKKLVYEACSPHFLSSLLEVCFTFSGNYTSKLHLCLIFDRELTHSHRVPFAGFFPKFREFVSSLKCLANPLRSALLLSSFNCALLIFDWSYCSPDHFLSFISLYTCFDIDLEQYFTHSTVALINVLVQNWEPTAFFLASVLCDTFDVQTVQNCVNSVQLLRWYNNIQFFDETNMIAGDSLFCTLYSTSRGQFNAEMLTGVVCRALDLIDSIAGDTKICLQVVNMLIQFILSSLSHQNTAEEAVFSVVNKLNCARNKWKVLVFLDFAFENNVSFVEYCFSHGLLPRRELVELNCDAIAETCSEDRYLQQHLTMLRWKFTLMMLKNNVSIDKVSTLASCRDCLESCHAFVAAHTIRVVNFLEHEMILKDVFSFETFGQLIYSSLDANHSSTGSIDYKNCIEGYFTYLLNRSVLSIVAPVTITDHSESFSYVIAKAIAALMIDLKPDWVARFAEYVSSFLVFLPLNSMSLESCVLWLPRLMVFYPVVEESASAESILHDLASYFPSFGFDSKMNGSCTILPLKTKTNFLRICQKMNFSSALCFVYSLLELDNEILESVKFKRQHINSSSYIRRLRLWLYICHFFVETISRADKNVKTTLIEIMTEKLRQNSDPSLRVLLEIALSHLLELSDICALTKNLDKQASTYTCSLLHTVGIFTLARLSDEQLATNFFDLCQIFLNWSSASHNNISLSSQIFLIRLHCRISKIHQLIPERYSYVTSLVYFWMNHVKFFSFLEKSAVASMYYEYFGRVESFSLDIIYLHIVSKFSISSAEVLNMEMPNNVTMEILHETGKSGVIPFEKSIFDLLDEPSSFSTTSQLKIVPDCSMDEMKSSGDANCKQSDEGLIIIASLVDRMTNLGGLARTGEVCGIFKLIVNSIKSIESSTDFSSVSVTAEKWLDIEEVRVDALMTYLLNLQTEGYTIVALEQSNRSVSLEKYKFPKKCAIVLGSEKYGVPVELLDACQTHVQIPQLGIIRSLNVHIATSLLIWQYNQQHRLPRG